MTARDEAATAEVRERLMPTLVDCLGSIEADFIGDALAAALGPWLAERERAAEQRKAQRIKDVADHDEGTQMYQVSVYSAGHLQGLREAEVLTRGTSEPKP